MAGIYIHIPFCKRKCHYCNFFSLATTQYRPEFLEAILKEIVSRKAYLQGGIVDSIYLGGGTPSLLTNEELRRIFDQLFVTFQISEQAEITLEANPDDLSHSFLKELKNTAVNRLSIGIQSFDNEELKYVNRVHNSEDAMKSIKASQDAGFDNLSLDLIYGIPNSSLNSWERNLRIIERTKASHLSAYSLTQEPNTAYDILVKKGKLQAPQDEKTVAQYQMLQDFLPQLNMEQYEISNYAADQKYALHNTNYWKGIPYLGLGPSAHSFNGKSRQWNISNLSKYMQSIKRGKVEAGQEILSLKDQWNEMIMTGIRTKWGVSILDMESRFPKEWILKLEERAKEFIQNGHLVKMDGVYVLSPQGKLYADGIAAEFFV
ncbi:MAG: radical SAM family heme chaperone HemW [Bacteroidales bacterium]|nr:radical SAM family heme chaperone HemW [Bacteroidales bacterium]